MTDEKSGKSCKCCMIVGIILIALSLSVDALGFGSSPVFGSKQIALLVVGVALFFYGLPSISKFCPCNKDKE